MSGLWTLLNNSFSEKPVARAKILDPELETERSGTPVWTELKSQVNSSPYEKRSSPNISWSIDCIGARSTPTTPGFFWHDGPSGQQTYQGHELQQQHQHQQQKRGSLQLWQFLVTLLDDPTNATCIAWTGKGMEFKLIEPEEVRPAI